jgi:hypothetical protein
MATKSPPMFRKGQDDTLAVCSHILKGDIRTLIENDVTLYTNLIVTENTFCVTHPVRRHGRSASYRDSHNR